MSKLKQVEEEALKLPAEERARLAHRLLESIEQTSDSDVEMAWIAEAERRHEELLSNPAVAEPAAIAFQRARDAIGDKR
jgi:putative addiction module component (TIGR02574 family)